MTSAKVPTLQEITLESLADAGSFVSQFFRWLIAEVLIEGAFIDFLLTTPVDNASQICLAVQSVSKKKVSPPGFAPDTPFPVVSPSCQSLPFFGTGSSQQVGQGYVLCVFRLNPSSSRLATTPFSSFFDDDSAPNEHMSRFVQCTTFSLFQCTCRNH